MKKSKSSKFQSENGAANKPDREDFLTVGIGASAGGIQALKGFFENVPADSGAAYVVILHLSPDHDSQLAAILQTVAKIPVRQVTEKVLVEPNRVYVVSPNQSLKMADGHIIVEPIHTVEERRAPIDIFFRTLAESLRDKETLQKLIGAQEDERKRIARDLHDHLGQQLTALRLKLEAVRKMSENDGSLCAKIDETQLIAKHIDADVDFLAWELRPAALDDLGLVAALENYVREWSRYSGVTAEFHAFKSKKTRLAPEVEINLYRITQEALNNTYKHAKAKSASVVLEERDNLIVLIIEDDGKGFNPKTKKNRSNGLGLIGMEERSALVGGTFEIESAPKQGTTVFVRVPASFVKKEKENA